jgi:hypothetical protein
MLIELLRTTGNGTATSWCAQGRKPLPTTASESACNGTVSDLCSANIDVANFLPLYGSAGEADGMMAIVEVLADFLRAKGPVLALDQGNPGGQSGSAPFDEFGASYGAKYPKATCVLGERSRCAARLGIA